MNSPNDPRLALWLASLSPCLRLTWEFLPPELQAAVFREYCGLVSTSMQNARKFALRAFREHNPEEVLNDPDEALIRGVGIKRLRTLREIEREAKQKKGRA